jgi:hypothetical protein
LYLEQIAKLQFKHASTVSSALAGIYTTFLLTHLKEPPPAFWLLVTSILCFFFVAGLSIFVLSNLAWHIREGYYNIVRQTSVVLVLTYSFFTIAFFSSIIFTVVNVPSIASKGAQDTKDEIKIYIKGYVDSTFETLLRGDIKDTITRELESFSSRIDSEILKTMEEHNSTMRQYINDELEKMLSITPPNSDMP